MFSSSAIDKAIARHNAMQQLDDQALEMMAVMMCCELDKYEEFLTKGLAMDHVSDLVTKVMGEEVSKEAINKAKENLALIQICKRFRDDLLANYPPAKPVPELFAKHQQENPSMVLFD